MKRNILYLLHLAVFLIISVGLYGQCIPNYFILRPKAECLGSQGIRISYTQEHYVAHDVYRKAVGDTSWGTPIFPNYWGNPLPIYDGSNVLINAFTASDHLPGQTYEYRFTRTFVGIGSFSGYILAGCEVAEVVFRGNVILMVSSELKPNILEELETMRKDLVADGYRVSLMETSESSTPPQVKSMIRQIYQSLEGDKNYLYIIGHVPVPYSGVMMSDDQPTHRGAWPADVYYGDLDGIYTDETMNTTVPTRPENDNIPGDGKFDQILITSKPEIAVGRADLSRLSCFVGKTEVDLTKRYLQKNHAFRNGQVNHSGKAFMCDNMEFYYGNNAATDGFIELYSKIGDNNFAALTNNIFPNYSYFLNVSDSLQSHSYLTSYISGTSGYTNIDNILSAGHINQMPSINSVFNWSFGAFFGDWDNDCNLMRMFIGAPGTSLTQIWGGNPSAYFHMFGFDRTIGETILEHQWNFNSNHHNLPNPNADNYYRRVHIALMGDPTLRLDYENPPVDPTVTVGLEPGTALISWASNGDNQARYLILRASNDDQPFEIIGETEANQLSFTDLTPLSSQSVYMVRAKALHTTGSGSYYNLSSGRFAPFNNASVFSSTFESDFVCLPNDQIEITFNISNNLNNSAATITCYTSSVADPLSVQSVTLNSNTPIPLTLPNVPSGTWLKYQAEVNGFPIAPIIDSVLVSQLPTSEISYEIQGGSLLLSTNISEGDSVEWIVDGDFLSNEATTQFEINSAQFSIDLICTNGCGSSSSNLEFNVTGGGDSVTSDWLMFPNPASEQITIQSENSYSAILIHDLTGRLLMQDQFSKGVKKSTISLSALKSGMYLCTVDFQGLKTTKRIVVQ
jgi:hypothetical protein